MVVVRITFNQSTSIRAGNNKALVKIFAAFQIQICALIPRPNRKAQQYTMTFEVRWFETKKNGGNDTLKKIIFENNQQLISKQDSMFITGREHLI